MSTYPVEFKMLEEENKELQHKLDLLMDALREEPEVLKKLRDKYPKVYGELF
jgi:hypothetical protein